MSSNQPMGESLSACDAVCTGKQKQLPFAPFCDGLSYEGAYAMGQFLHSVHTTSYTLQTLAHGGACRPGTQGPKLSQVHLMQLAHFPLPRPTHESRDPTPNDPQTLCTHAPRLNTPIRESTCMCSVGCIPPLHSTAAVLARPSHGRRLHHPPPQPPPAPATPPPPPPPPGGRHAPL